MMPRVNSGIGKLTCNLYKHPNFAACSLWLFWWGKFSTKLLDKENKLHLKFSSFSGACIIKSCLTAKSSWDASGLSGIMCGLTKHKLCLMCWRIWRDPIFLFDLCYSDWFMPRLVLGPADLLLLTVILGLREQKFMEIHKLPWTGWGTKHNV